MHTDEGYYHIYILISQCIMFYKWTDFMHIYSTWSHFCDVPGRLL